MVNLMTLWFGVALFIVGFIIGYLVKPRITELDYQITEAVKMTERKVSYHERLGLPVFQLKYSKEVWYSRRFQKFLNEYLESNKLTYTKDISEVGVAIITFNKI